MLDHLIHLLQDLPGFLDGFIQSHGPWVYALLFAIVFCETGLVVTPFLPGDSLLFTVGALAARGSMNPWLAACILLGAAVLGNTSNYWIGRLVGPRIFKMDYGPGDRPPLIGRLLNKKHLDRAHGFFEKYGGKAVMIGQFVPIVRTFCPFVAGAGAMNYPRFIMFNISGGLLWVGICVGAGWFFGNIEWVKKNFEAVVIGIVFISLVPIAVEFIVARARAKSGSVAVVHNAAAITHSRAQPGSDA